MNCARSVKKTLRTSPSHPYDIIVCGGGHAGCEAALIAARMGADVLLLTGNLDTLAQMSCNPAVGGEAKGHMIREIDALGGEMAINADYTALQFKLLNASKGPAVQSPRAQSDKKAYQYRMKWVLELQPGLSLFQDIASDFITTGDKIAGVKTRLGIDIYAKTVILTAGTFLKALMHVGDAKAEGGRMGDFAAQTLSGALLERGIRVERFKTGTPPRILGSSIDFNLCQKQEGDANPVFFAFYDTREEEDLFHVEHYGNKTQPPGWKPGSVNQPCWITYTTDKTQSIVTTNLHRSALYKGEIKGTGPRYCPSIEDKYVKFGEKENHRIFLEPEGLQTDEWYVNGLSTSLPFDTQMEIMETIPGLEHAQIVRPGYAVEYDYIPPTQLFPNLESKLIENLFFAGQINGTTGYAEAAAQGLVAGINAVLKTRGEPALIMRRHESYIGVLIDDLVTKGTNEPYRMFTSRAEYRLLLNAGSADIRLFDHSKRIGALSPSRLAKTQTKKETVENLCNFIEKTGYRDGSLGDAIRRDPLSKDYLFLPEKFTTYSESTKNEILYRTRYKGYLDRDLRQIEKYARLDAAKIPLDFDFFEAKGLRIEAQQKLSAIRPENLDQASRISGVTPADVMVLSILLQK